MRSYHAMRHLTPMPSTLFISCLYVVITRHCRPTNPRASTGWGDINPRMQNHIMQAVGGRGACACILQTALCCSVGRGARRQGGEGKLPGLSCAMLADSDSLGSPSAALPPATSLPMCSLHVSDSLRAARRFHKVACNICSKQLCVRGEWQALISGGGDEGQAGCAAQG